MAGCHAPDLAPTEPADEVRFTSETGEITGVFTDIRRYLAADATLRDGVQLAMKFSTYRYDHRLFTLDEASMVRRTAVPCYLHEVETDVCRKGIVDWYDSQRLPPMGLAWPTLLTQPGPMPPGITLAKEGNRILANGVDPLRGGASPGTQAVLTYGAGQLPESIEIHRFQQATLWTNSGGNLELPPLAAAEPTTGAAADATFDGYAFPGETYDWFGVGYTVREALEGLLDADTTARSLWDEGACLREIHLELPPANRSKLVPLELLSSPSRLDVTLSVGDKGTTWYLLHRRDAFAGSSFDVERREEHTFAQECPSHAARPPQVPWARAWATINATGGSHQGLIDFVYGYADANQDGWPEAHYGLFAIPASADTSRTTFSYHPATVTVDAMSGRLLAIGDDSDRVLAIDE